ncbi:MAG: hypothetical protein K2L02_06220, partial [Clostridia bacterium]|nr:hypothetical protein [Clostridia bacterium]
MDDKTRKIKKVEKCVLSILIALVIAAGAFVAGWYGRWGALGKKKQDLLWAIDTAQEKYYKDIDEDALYNMLFSAFDLDRYSTYYSKVEYETVAAEREGVNRDAGFSVWQESRLQVYVNEGSSAHDPEIESGMNFFKYGKTDVKEDMTASNNAESYFEFIANLAKGEKYYVLCGESDQESEAEVYEVTNEESGAGIALIRKYDPMRIYQVGGNSTADIAGLRKGMYILKYGATEEVEKMVSGSPRELSAFISTLKPDAEGKYTLYLQCGFDK